MTDPQRFSQTHSDLFGLFKAELARSDAMTGLVDAGRALWPRFATFYRDLARLPRKARRALQRRWRRSLGGIALLCALGHVPTALAGQIDVGVGGCALVDAITAANADEQMGGCLAGSGVDTISLPPGSIQTLTSENNYSGGYNGLPVITSAIVIQGNGGTIRRASSAPQFRIVAVDPNGDLSLRDITLSGGAAAGDGDRPGGGVFNEGALTLINSTVSGNSAGTHGGGLYNTGTLTLTNSTVAGNFADSLGGGVFSFGALALTNSTVSGNSARYGGGAASGGVGTLANSTVSGNFAGSFGGGVLSSGALALTNSTVSGNSAAFDGGGVRNFGTLTLTNSTISGNSAASQGPEVFNVSGDQSTPGGIIISNGFNLFGHDGLAGVDGVVSGVPGASDLVPAIPLTAILDPALAANGGSTRTHALVSGSPAIDAIPAASCVTTADQRGVTRPQDGDEDTVVDCDIGAFERQLPPPAPPPPPPPEATSAEPNPQLRCTGSACRVLIKCDAVQGSVEPCHTSVVIFVRASALRLADDGAGKARRRIRFASAVANIPPGGTTNLRLRLTKRGRHIVRAGRNRRLSGVMEIRNSIGPVQSIPVRLRLRR
ncbi:MAG: right-handed parallel beta-helix repeat-containing protein [Pseudomonadota bacterium]|nr:right-handed parallel beta-helix repeat-containing protein [Gammaproteobacteria bacterium]MDQ3580428.1 right-handed parallel beta-helix repeat-containing protein [Pseudomonadota bacterium]